MALEPRVMYDAAAAATVGAAAQTHQDAAADHAAIAAVEKQATPVSSNTGAPAAADPTSAAKTTNVPTPAPVTVTVTDDTAKTTSSLDASSTAVPVTAASPREVVFIDPQSADLMNLYNGVKGGDLVFVLDPTKDGLQQIADILAAQNLHDLDAIHIVSHGTEAEIQLGTTILSGNNVANHAAALAAIGASLNANADILLYGCNVAAGADGQQLITDIARLTGADVAASTDATGSADLGGNWTLEAVTGTITATMPFTDAALAGYHGSLAIQFYDGSETSFASPQFPVRVVVGDFNKDGKIDMIYQTGADGSAWNYLQGNGNGTFAAAVASTAAGSPFRNVALANYNSAYLYRVADFDNDGDSDIWVAATNTTGTFYRNDNGVYSLQSSAGFPSLPFIGRISQGDFDGDGDQDFLYQVGVDGTAFMYVRNDSVNGTLHLTTLAQGSSPFSGVTLPNMSANGAYKPGDFDGDGDTDIWIQGAANSNHGTYLRNDNGTYVAASSDAFPAVTFSARTLVGDFDSDGDADILFQTGLDGTGFSVMRGGTFDTVAQASSVFAGLTLPNFNLGDVNRLADYDGDGDIDIYIAAPNSTGNYFIQGASSAVTGQPPRLSSSTPSDNATGVPPSADITLTFSESVTKGSTGSVYIVRASDNSIVETIPIGDARITGSGTTWTINPNTTLAGGTGYAVRVDSKTFVDSDGAVFFGIYDNTTLNFTTGAANTPPTITSDGAGATALKSVAENSTAVTTITATDPDAGTTLTYSIAGGADAAKFAINASTGALSFVSAPDFENPTDAGGNNVYDVTVQVSDGTLADSQAIAVTVTNVNEAPTITSNGAGSTASVNVAENSTAVATVTATDPDAGATQTYSITGGADAAKFIINATTGALSFVSAPDFETPTDAGANNVYDVTVQVSDGTLTDTQAIAVTVTNVNDNTPVITSNGGGVTAAVNVVENTTAVTTVTSADADAGTTLTYSIAGGADAAKFAINASTGALRFVSAPDFENPTDAGADNVYDVTVQVSDGSLTDTQAIAVTVTNVNEAPVITSNGGGDIALQGVAENSTIVTTVTATDSDVGATQTYSISGGADAAKFTINATTGALRFVSAPDFENPTDAGADNVYDVTVQVSDGTLTDTQAIAVKVTNVNEAPAITSNGAAASASVNVAENTTAVTTVTATDPDAGTTLTYSITGGADAAKFAINATTGALSFVSAPDFENPTDAGANNVYDVTVQVSDGTLNDTQAIAVTVTNINEAPVITSNGGGAAAAVNVAENSTAVATVTATDSDVGSTQTYSILGGADAARFTINATTGALSFVSDPDFETPTDAGADNIYDVTVHVSDGSLTATQTIAVTVTNVNESPAITSNGAGATASVNVTENSTAVTTVTASDPDAGSTQIYSISGGADAAKFAINATTGALSFVSAPDFENPTDAGANNVYDVTVQVSDGTLNDTQAIAVTVTNINEAPVITSNGGGAAAAVNVAENSTAVATVTATDSDVGSTQTYSISGGADAARFTINATTGALSFVSAPDFETPTDAGADNVYDLTVQVSDGTLTDTQAIAVTVTNVNEAPVITSNGGGNAASVNVTENSTAVTTVTTTDPDAGTTLTYSISGGADATKFAINATTGALSFVSAPDFENPTDAGANSIYDVTVQVSDGSAVDTQAIAVTVTDVNEAPTITSNGAGSTASVNVAENSTAVTTATTTDPDAGTTLTYSITGGADAAKFVINASTGALSFVSAPDFENPADAGADNIYDVTVQVSDGALTDSQNIAVTVIDVNDNAPVIASNGGGTAASVSVAENSTAVTTVTATDADAGTVFTYSITGGVDAAKFAINASTGALSFVSAPDFENPTDAGANNVYDVTVQVSDGSLTDTQAIAVTVTNVNEAPAISSNGAGATASVNVAENSTAVTTVTATDSDAGSTQTYSITGGVDAAKFFINATTGALSFVSAPDFETPTDAGADNVYDVTVQVSDGSLTDTQAIAVTVTNANEAPVITSNGGAAASVNVAENSTAVTTVTANDPDAGSTQTYSISGGADAARFTINATTGALSFVSAPDFETPTDVGANNVYDVTVKVSDGSLTDTQVIAVTVINVNEAPVISSNGAGATASVNVAENSTAVTTVTATDSDAGSTQTYSITGGADAAKFVINATTGALSFVSAPDFETPTDAGANNIYDVTVQVSDGSLTDTQAIAVTVTNANEAPVITSNGGGAAASVNVAENSTAVTTITASDPDAGSTQTYSITGGADAAKFAINTTTGALSFVSAPDFENPTDAGADNVYDVTVQVSDGSLTDTQAIAVTVTNVNEAPVITSNGGGTAASIIVAENGTAVTAVAATDPDAGTSLTYKITGGGDAAKFTIDATTGVLTFVTAPDFETPTDAGGDNVYDVTVQVSDGSLTDTQAIAVTVANVNEAPSGANHTVVTAEDTSYTFIAGDFGFSDASDSPANTLQSVIITTVPVAGTLTDNGVAVTAGHEVSAAHIAGGLLVFTPGADGNGSGYAAFTFQVKDNGGTASGGVDTDPVAKTLTIDVTPVNDAPVVNSGKTLSFDANAGTPITIDAAIAVHDVDNTTLSSASVAITAGLETTDDKLAFVNQNGITGAYNSATGVLTLSGVASVADYQAALASVTFTSTTQSDGARTVQWTVNDGSADSLASNSTVNVSGVVAPPHVFAAIPQVDVPRTIVPASLSLDPTYAGPLVPPAAFSDGAAAGGAFGYTFVHTAPVLTTTADAGLQIDLVLAALEAPLGGNVASVTARLVNGDPLPDWLKFNPATGTFAGLAPDNAVAALEATDNDIVTGSIPRDPNVGAGTGPASGPGPASASVAKTISVQVTARDYKGNVAVTVFTIELRPPAAGKQGWNIDRHGLPTGFDRHAQLPALSSELAAIEAALYDVKHVIEPFALRGLPMGHVDVTSDSPHEPAVGRAGLTEQLASIGWRSMAAQRNALLASLR